MITKTQLKQENKKLNEDLKKLQNLLENYERECCQACKFSVKINCHTGLFTEKKYICSKKISCKDFVMNASAEQESENEG